MIRDPEYYDPLEIPNPHPEYHFAWCSTRYDHPAGVRAMARKNYQVTTPKWAKEMGLGIEDRGIADGGLVDKTNNCITTGDLVLMHISREEADNRRRAKWERTTSMYTRAEDDLQALGDRLGVEVADLS